MIGQDYFDLRSRLGTALFSLARLVPEAGTNPDHGVILNNLVSSLKDPFVFVVVGEVNVGKSTFLNALFGAEFSRTGVVPTTDHICFFKHGAVEKHVQVTKTLEEIHVPADFLKDFHIVDTPGTNSVECEHQEITERFVPMADLVIFVFSAMNPWGASAWQFLDKVHRHWMRHVLFVLQQSDLRTPEEITAILDYMRQLTRQRFEREFPIFPVSAKKAYLARSSGLDRDRLMAESGFAALEDHVSRSLGGNAQRVSKLANALRIAWEILGAIQAQAGNRAASREDKSSVLRHIDGELAAHRERTQTKLQPIVEATSRDLEHECDDLIRRIRLRLTTRFTLSCVLREKRKVEGLEQLIIDAVRVPALERWDHAGAIVEDDVGNYAGFLTEQIQSGLKVQMREELRPDDTFWKAQRRRFGQRMEQILNQCVHDTGAEAILQPALPKSRRWAAILLAVAIIALVASVIEATRGHWKEAGIIEAAGLVLAGLIWWGCSRMLKRTRAAGEEALRTAAPKLRGILSSQLRDDVNNLYDGFARVLDPMREKLSEQERRQTNFSAQIADLAQTFTELSTEVHAISVGESPPTA